MNALRKLAVIDCGTNTFNLRVVEMGAKGGWIPVFGQRVPVKLGKGGVAKGVIQPDRMARGLDALVSMREALRNYDVEEVHVLATSAIHLHVRTQPLFYGNKIEAEAKRLVADRELVYRPLQGGLIHHKPLHEVRGASTRCALDWKESVD